MIFLLVRSTTAQQSVVASIAAHMMYMVIFLEEDHYILCQYISGSLHVFHALDRKIFHF